MRNRRNIRTSLYRGKANAHRFGHFKMKKRLSYVKSFKDLKKMSIRGKGGALKRKYENVKKYTFKRKRYFPRNLSI